MSNNETPKFSNLIQRAEALRLMGEYDDAIGMFDKAIKNAEEKPEKPRRIAWTYAHRGEAYFQRGLTKKDYEDAEYDFFHENEEAEDDGSAISDFNTALERVGNNYAWAHAHLGEVYRIKAYHVVEEEDGDAVEQYQLAIDSFDKAIKQDPHYAWALAHRGATICNARGDIGGYKEALSNLKYADELMGDEYAWAKAYKAVAYALLGEDLGGDEKNYQRAFAEMNLAVMADSRVLEKAFEPGKSQTGFDHALGIVDLFIRHKEFEIADDYCQLALRNVAEGGRFAKLNDARARYRIAQVSAGKYGSDDQITRNAIDDASNALAQAQAEFDPPNCFPRRKLSRAEKEALRDIRVMRQTLNKFSRKEDREKNFKMGQDKAVANLSAELNLHPSERYDPITKDWVAWQVKFWFQFQ